MSLMNKYLVTDEKDDDPNPIKRCRMKKRLTASMTSMSSMNKSRMSTSLGPRKSTIGA